ncbi:response regulator [Rhodoplanes sp. Z2-YC6860]|uniref:response regulator n=1 Tax=Rhodoplanes sp. Z2-YC6860 TaxID=674703 RepID=UPI00078C246E|nr:response regulator [Rhodoplanes sp. Z2-YC6860]AMN40988.1 Signal transduction histidine kinase [Rhodoplanes sp. Z2-YC6860]
MTDEFVSLKLMIVSEDAAERELIRRGVSDASIPVDISEVKAARDETTACRLLAQAEHDVVLFDERMPSGRQHALLEAVRATPGHPLAVMLGQGDAADRCDALIAKPIDHPQVSEVIGDCIAVRLPKRVLIVDDSAAVRSVIQKVLNGSRFRIHADEADGYAVAVEKFKARRFDVVILDCDMSGKDGFETLAELRKVRGDAKILMTAETHDTAMEKRARSNGAGDFLTKPFFAKDVDVAFSRLLGLRQIRWR